MEAVDEIYAFQHFGFSATQVSIERKHLVESLLLEAIDSMIKKITPSPATVDLLNLLKNEIAENMLNAMKTELEELAALDRKKFAVPDHVLLVTDFDHVNNYTKKQFKELQHEIEIKRHLFLENSVMIKSLEQQEEKFELIKPCIEKHLITIEKSKAAIEMLSKNKLCNVNNLAHATYQVAEKLCANDSTGECNKKE